MLPHPDEYVPLYEACDLFPGKPCRRTLQMWASQKGCKGVRLQTFRSGWRVFTTRAAVAEFHRALNELANTPAAEVETPKEKARRREATYARLRAAGYKF